MGRGGLGGLEDGREDEVRVQAWRGRGLTWLGGRKICLV